MRYEESKNKLIRKGNYKVALLIDFGYIYQIAKGAEHIKSKDKAIALLRKKIEELAKQKINDCNGKFIIVGEGGNNFRKQINKDYKKGRKHEPIYWMKTYKEYLENKKSIFSIPTFEADDAIGVLHTHLEQQYRIKNIDYRPCIVSADKDFNQFEGHRYSPKGYHRDAKFIYVTKEQSAYNFWYQVLIGDSIDNIKGIPNVGDKAAKLILEHVDLMNKLGTGRCKFKDIFRYRDEVYKCYIKKYGVVKEGTEQFELNKRMVKMVDIKDELFKQLENFKFPKFKRIKI